MLKLQYFGHLMQRADSLEKTLMLGKTEGRRRREQQRTRCLDGITDTMDMSLSKIQEMGKEWGAWCTAVHGWQRVGQNWATEQPFMPSLPKGEKRNCFHLQAKYLQFYLHILPGPPASLKVHADSHKCSIFINSHFSNLFPRMMWNITQSVRWLLLLLSG